MQYNNQSDDQDLVHLLNDLTGMDDNVYPLKQKTRDMNTANRTIWGWIHEAYGGWLYDDSNNTLDFPTATANLVSGQQDYTLPSEALTVRGIEVKTTGGVWQELTAITEEYIRQTFSEKEFMKTPAQPTYYTAYANSIKLYPPANYSQNASIRVSYDRGTINFLSTDTTKTPGFASLFHEAVAYGAAKTFALYKQLPQAGGVMRGGFKTGLNGEWQDWENSIKKYYQERWEEKFPPQISVRDYTRENQ